MMVKCEIGCTDPDNLCPVCEEWVRTLIHAFDEAYADGRDGGEG